SNTGYDVVPWDGMVTSDLNPDPDPFGTPMPSGQFARLAADDNFIHAQARINQFQGIRVDNAPCPVVPGRNDYPRYPTGADAAAIHASYTCIRADFTNAGHPDPMGLSAVIDKSG